MTRLLFRSKSTDATDHALTVTNYDGEEDVCEDDEEEDDDEWEDESFRSPITTPFISPATRTNTNTNTNNQNGNGNGNGQHSVLTILASVLRKSLVTCSVETEDLDISYPTDVKHISHVTFDRFNGFLGLPAELQPEVPKRVPSASASVFGVSAQSMQCSYDHRGNSVPTILLMMQERLYSEGGLQAEGIFRITAENSQEEYVKSQLNKGIVPPGIDIHCLAGLMKAWLRELPTGVLDSLAPEQVMRCNSEEECSRLVKLLPLTEAAILDWAVNLMADVVSYEHYNKMNARNIAMVFAPNMTQMADPLTALIHAVQVMNFLKTLIEKTLRKREEDFTASVLLSSCSNNVTLSEETQQTNMQLTKPASNFLRSATLDKLESHSEEKFWSFKENNKSEELTDNNASLALDPSVQKSEKRRGDGLTNSEGESILDRLSFSRGVKKLRCNRVFQLNWTLRRNAGVGIVNAGRSGREESCA